MFTCQPFKTIGLTIALLLFSLPLPGFTAPAQPASFARSLRLLTASSSSTAELYVAPNGSDSNPGTLAQPLATLNKAASLATPGMAVYVRGGVYDKRVVIYASGTASAPISFLAYPGEAPLIDGAQYFINTSEISFTRDMALVQIGEPGNEDVAPLDDTGNYVTFSGFTVQHSPGRGISVTGDHVQISNNRITQSDWSGLLTRKSIGSKLSSNEIWDTARWNADHTKDGGWAPALSVYASNDVEVSHNIIHDNHGEGIDALRQTDGTQISENVVYDNWGVNIYLDQSANNVVKKNLIYETNTVYIPRYVNGVQDPKWRELAVGIGLGDEKYSENGIPVTTCNLRDNTIRNNIIVNARSGVSFFPYMACTGLKNLQVEGNTVVDTWDYGTRVVTSTEVPLLNNQGTVFRNNIFSAKQGKALKFQDPDDTRFENNLLFATGGVSTSLFEWGLGVYDFAGWQALPGMSANLWNAPLLANQGAWNAEGQMLTARSPAIDHGTTAYTNADYWGNARPVDGDADGVQAYDIGAQEYPGPFMEQSGEVTIEAEHYDSALARSDHSWMVRNDRSGFVGTGFMTAAPDSGAYFGSSDLANSPELRYAVWFKTPGAYTAWMRTSADNSSANSLYVGLNGQSSTSLSTNVGDWGWNGTAAVLQVPSAGLYTISLWMREDGLRLDRLVLKTGSGSPSATGPAESIQSGAMPPPSTRIKTMTFERQPGQRHQWSRCGCWAGESRNCGPDPGQLCSAHPQCLQRLSIGGLQRGGRAVCHALYQAPGAAQRPAADCAAFQELENVFWGRSPQTPAVRCARFQLMEECYSMPGLMQRREREGHQHCFAPHPMPTWPMMI